MTKPRIAKSLFTAAALVLTAPGAFAETKTELKDFVGSWTPSAKNPTGCHTKTIEIKSDQHGKVLHLNTSLGVVLKVQAGAHHVTREPKLAKHAIGVSQYFGGVISSTHSIPFMKKDKEFMTASLRTFQLENDELVTRVYGYGAVRNANEEGVHRVADLNTEVAVARQGEDSGTVCRYERAK